MSVFLTGHVRQLPDDVQPISMVPELEHVFSHLLRLAALASIFYSYVCY